ncbi:MAG: M48 family metalloprotease [Deltaproteobacteria bacterium]|nr:M48 family metalloprotease [Deltaproteobacteria bacterium]
MRDPCATPQFKKRQNLLQTIIILLGMLTLFGFLGFMLMGKIGILWSISFGMVLMATTPKIPPRIFLQRQGAVYLSPTEASGLYEILGWLSRGAQIPATPKLFLLKHDVMNAFSMGRRSDAAIVVTDALLRKLDWRETAGILAHEVGHIGNNDLFLHTVADTMTRVTSLLSTFGQILILLYLPLLLFSDMYISPLVLILLLLAPAVSTLLQLALSRTREFEADQTAAYLTGDPKSLASALGKMEGYDQNFWKTVFMPRRRNLTPSALRTHPHTEERVARLWEIAKEMEARPADCPESPQRFSGMAGENGFRSNWHWLKSWLAHDE